MLNLPKKDIIYFPDFENGSKSKKLWPKKEIFVDNLVIFNFREKFFSENPPKTGKNKKFLRNKLFL